MNYTTVQELFEQTRLSDIVHLLDEQHQAIISQHLHDKCDQINQSTNREIDRICRQTAQIPTNV